MLYDFVLFLYNFHFFGFLLNYNVLNIVKVIIV